MDELNQRLQGVFRFIPNDVRANREGRLYARQQAVLQAAGSNMCLAIGMFIFVMLGTFGILAFSFIRSSVQLGEAELNGRIIVAGVVGLVILVGALVFGIPLAASAMQGLSGIARVLVFVVLLAIGFGFVYWASRRLQR